MRPAENLGLGLFHCHLHQIYLHALHWAIGPFNGLTSADIEFESITVNNRNINNLTININLFLAWLRNLYVRSAQAFLMRADHNSFINGTE